MNAKQEQIRDYIYTNLNCFFTECIPQSIWSGVSEYSSPHSHTRTLTSEREKFLDEVETVIKSFADMDLQQIKSTIENQSLAVRYFIVERVFIQIKYLESHGAQNSVELLNDYDELPVKISQNFLSKMWNEFVEMLAENDIPLDNYLSHIYNS